MSLITRCPACQTSFKVVADQLRISEGWVRCGQCQHVFDASMHMVPSLADVVSIDGQMGGNVDEAIQSAPLDLEVPTHLDALDVDVGQAATALESSDISVPEVPPIAGQEPAQLVTQLAPESLLPDDLPGGQANTQDKLEVGAAEPDMPPSISFLREMPKASSWHKAWVRAALGIVALFLLAGLALQVMVQERDRIASLLPKSKPLLDMVCERLNCEISPLRQIESIAIESSSFSKIRGDAYRLALVVKNNAPVGLAMPSFELTLTDNQDQTVMRKVLPAAEFGAASSVIAANSEWATAMDLSVRANGAGERFSGYRILAFYP